MSVLTRNSFSSDNISDRIAELYKKINISRFAEEHSLARKTLYKMKEKGVIPRDLLFLLCKEADINPILVEFSVSERLFYFSCLSEYVRSVSVEELYSGYLISAKKEHDYVLLASLNLVHKMMVEGDIAADIYEQRIKEILKETKPVK